MFGNTFGTTPEGNNSECTKDDDCDPIPCLIPPCPRDICVNGSCVLDDGNLPNPECVRDADCPVLNCFVPPCDVNVCNLGVCELQAPAPVGVSETAVSSSETTVSSETATSSTEPETTVSPPEATLSSETTPSSETAVSSPETTVSSETTPSSETAVSSETTISSPGTPASSSETATATSSTEPETTVSSETTPSSETSVSSETAISSPESPPASSETTVSSSETTVSSSETTTSSETTIDSSPEGLFNGATAQRTDVTRSECTEDHNGILVADSLDGSSMSVFAMEYLCETNGLPPIGNIYPRNILQSKDGNGNPVASNGEVCCGKKEPTPTPAPTQLRRTPAPSVVLVNVVEGGEPVSIGFTSGAEVQASKANMASFVAALITLGALVFENFVNFFIEDAWV